jgi:heme/copper-type cytochrome/quinol oxidase subunit 2
MNDLLSFETNYIILDLLFNLIVGKQVIFLHILFYICIIYIMVRRSRSTRREPPTMGKQLENFITIGWESSAPFL